MRVATARQEILKTASSIMKKHGCLNTQLMTASLIKGLNGIIVSRKEIDPVRNLLCSINLLKLASLFFAKLQTTVRRVVWKKQVALKTQVRKVTVKWTWKSDLGKTFWEVEQQIQVFVLQIFWFGKGDVNIPIERVLFHNLCTIFRELKFAVWQRKFSHFLCLRLGYVTQQN